jgi:type VI secretion system protein VasD
MALNKSEGWASPRWLPGRGAFLLALTLSVCSHEVRPCETPPPFYLTLEAGSKLNPDEHHRPLPTQFLVLQLKGEARFSKASFDDIWQHPKETLGEELLQSNEVSVAPGATVTVGFQRHAQATMVGVVGVFREHSGDSWRAVAVLPNVSGDRCTAQPTPIKSKPTPDDVELKFQGDQDTIENRTPPPVSRGCA